MSAELFYTILYILISVCILYPPTEFVNAGFNIPDIFSPVLGSESEDFIRYHMKRSCITLLVLSSIPLGYIFGLAFFVQQEGITSIFSTSNSAVWQMLLANAVLFPLMALFQTWIWLKDGKREHPIVRNLAKFCNNNSDWKAVASDINREYRSIEKICIQANAISKIVATENWILKVRPLTIFIAHQSDTSFVVNRSDTHTMSQNSSGEVQYITIEVKSRRENVETFNLRLNSADFKDLQDRISRTITVLPNVKFHKTLVDKFVDAFKDAVQENSRFLTNQERENCMGCMQEPSNVKLQKMCVDNESDAVKCSNCYCRPMWCMDCMAKWFASRQDNEHVNEWLSSKCTCPMCRATFCVLDVCPIDAIMQ